MQAGWFTGTKALLSLKLEGNLLTRLDPGSFPLNDFRSLETLDLSDNLIDFLNRNSFRGLVSLRSLDLSRNRLSSVPPEAFSYLVWLSNLNLDLNSWNCTCELLELAAVLSNFIQEPDKTLYNGRRMVCVSADNPAVTTVLELTEANCIPSNQNITVQLEARGSVTPQRYARDLAIAAVICFLGGVALTLLVVLICYQVSKRMKKKESQRLKEGDEGRRVANHVHQLDGRERRRDFSLQANSSQLWNKESMMLDHHSEEFRSRAEENFGSVGGHRNTNGKMPSHMRKGVWVNGGIETKDDQERRKSRVMVEEERNGEAIQQQHLSWGHLLRETPDNLPPYKADSDMDSYRTDEDIQTIGYEILHCRNCHRTYRPPEQNTIYMRAHSNHTDSVSGRFRRELSEKMKNAELKRKTRRVKFDLRSLRTNQGKESLEEEVAANPRDDGKNRDRRHKVQSSRSMKVKLNLNPLKKSKVHPRKKNEQSHSENRTSKRNKERRHHRKEEEEEGEEKSREKRRGCRERRRKSSQKAEGTNGGGHKSSSSEKDQLLEADQEKDGHPDSSQPTDSTTVSAQALNLRPLQYQTAGLTLGGAQHPFSFNTADRDRITGLSLLGSAGSQLTGSSLPLQAGKALLNTMASGSNPLLPAGLTNPIAAGITFSGLNIASSSATERLKNPAGGNHVLLAKTTQADHLHEGGIHPAPPLNSKCEDQALSLANPDNNPAPLDQSQMQVDSSAPVAALKLDLTLDPDIHSGKGRFQSTTESKAPSTKDSLPEQGHAQMSGDTSQVPEPETRVVSTINMASERGEAHTEGPGVGASGESIKAARESVMEISASNLTQLNESSPADGGAALLQQEYLSEEGGSSPRRRLRLVLPEKTSNRPPTALERKIR